MISKKYTILTAESDSFEGMSQMLLAGIPADCNPLRLSFFGGPADNKEYLAQLDVLKEKVREKYGDKSPVVTYVAQKPLVGTLKLELTTSDWSEMVKTDFHGDYLVLGNGSWRELIIGGILSDDLSKPVYEQSSDIFARIDEILSSEGFAIEDIVRQWNYIEEITGGDSSGKQNYQEFNDARSEFYSRGKWDAGYPAATGIGTQLGGIMVELNAIKGEGLDNIPVDNSLQVAAHSYSQKVLIGRDNNKSTPKFERARIIGGNGRHLALISGTAAIRGEESLTGTDIALQTKVTMENIEYLISEKNTGIPGRRTYKLLRVYIKNPEDLEFTRDFMKRNYPDVPRFSLYADICRDELLIEIEGVSEITQ